MGTAALLLLIAAGVVLIAVGFLRDTDGSPSTPASTSSTPATPGPAAIPASQPPQQAQPQTPIGLEGRRARVALHTASFAGRFAIGVAPDWTAAEEGTYVAVTAPGSDVEIDIYFEAGDRPLGELGRSAASFLRSRHPGSDLNAPQQQRLAHLPALQIVASYADGVEAAIVLTTGGYTYLVLERADEDAAGRLMAQAHTELASFRPL